MKSCVVTSRAIRDLNQIWDYLSQDSIETANRVLTTIENAFSKLAKSPGIGHFREDLADQRYKFFLVYSYLIVYRFQASPIEVIRVLHVSRDIQAILGMTFD